MDPTATLVTFFLETDPSVKSVQLIGSWDNFSSCYTMHRDLRRGRGQWRACHSLANTANSNARRAVNAQANGLSMGQTYYYYYEVNGSSETHNANLPSTNTCPHLPGQTLNVLHVPVERSQHHQRSVSLNSLKKEDFRTMDPSDRYVNPKPVDSDNVQPLPRLATAFFTPPASRSSSPTQTPSWKRFFKRSPSKTDLRGRSFVQDTDEESITEDGPVSSFYFDDANSSRSATPSEGFRTRDISPESLRRFLIEDGLSSRPASNLDIRPTLDVLQDIEEEAEVDDDDDNFASAMPAEATISYTTGLSPPPSQRSKSSETVPRLQANGSAATLIPLAATADAPVSTVTSLPKLNTDPNTTSTFFSSPLIGSPDDESSMYDSDEVDSTLGYKTYSLPRPSYDTTTKNPIMSPTLAATSPTLLARADAGVNLLPNPLDSGFDFASQFTWMVDSINR